MESLREIFKIGKGPSSSHTMGPQRAAIIFAERHPEAARFEVTLYGSLAATGKFFYLIIPMVCYFVPIIAVKTS